MQAIRRLLVLLVVLAPIAVGRAQTVVDFTTTTPTGVQAHNVEFQNLTTTTALGQAWFWDFGDGSLGSSKKSPTHTYTSGGAYTVTLFVFPLGEAMASATKPDFIVVTPAVLDVDFTTSTTSGVAPLVVAFSGTALGTGNITEWTWTFGDGQSATGQDVVHTYTQVGKRSVTLEVSAGDPVAKVTKTDLIEVLPPDLQPSFTFQPSKGYAPLEVQFVDTSTGPHDTWDWTFDDGPKPWWAALENPTHVYTVPGVYDVTLTIGFGGSTASVSVPGAIEVIDPALVPTMSVFPRGGFSPLSVTFTDTSTSEVPYTLTLDFDDESPHGHASVTTHVYSGTRWFSPVQTITTIPGPNKAVSTLSNAIHSVEPEVATFVSFAEPELSFLGITMSDLTIADFSGDGLPDLLVEIPSQPEDPEQAFSVFVQDEGSFQTIAKTFLPAVHNPAKPDVSGVADMDEDGALDLVLVPWNIPAPVSIWHGDGAGGFTLQSDTPLPDTPEPGFTVARWSAVLDVDADGHVDCVVGADHLLTIFGGDGRGGFASVSPPGAKRRFDGNPTVLDVDLDGHLDLVGFVEFDTVKWLPGDGLGFGLPVDVPIGDLGALPSLDVGDVTGDGLVDLVVASYPDILVARGTGAGFDDFVADATPHIGGLPIRLGDLDADGRADMLSAFRHDVRVTRFDPDGEAGFASGLSWHPAAQFPDDLQLVDVDADGGLDVLMAYAKFGGIQKFVTVHRNLGIVGRWVDIGGEMTGAAGELHLEGRGELRRGTRVVLELTGAAPASPAFLVVGLSDLMQPFAGGVLVPAVDAVIGGVTDGLGEVEWLANWPGNVPAMTPNWYQAWVVEGGAFAGSNGLLSIATE